MTLCFHLIYSNHIFYYCFQIVYCHWSVNKFVTFSTEMADMTYQFWAAINKLAHSSLPCMTLCNGQFDYQPLRTATSFLTPRLNWAVFNIFSYVTNKNSLTKIFNHSFLEENPSFWYCPSSIHSFILVCYTRYVIIGFYMAKAMEI